MLSTREIIKAINNINSNFHKIYSLDSKKYNPKANFNEWNDAINCDVGKSIEAILQLEKRCNRIDAKLIDNFMHDLPLDYGVHCKDPIKYAEAQDWSYTGVVDSVFDPLCRVLKTAQQKRLQAFARLGA